MGFYPNTAHRNEKTLTQVHITRVQSTHVQFNVPLFCFSRQVVENNLFKKTQLQTSFSGNMLALGSDGTKVGEVRRNLPSPLWSLRGNLYLLAAPTVWTEVDLWNRCNYSSKGVTKSREVKCIWAIYH